MIIAAFRIGRVELVLEQWHSKSNSLKLSTTDKFREIELNIWRLQLLFTLFRKR